MSERTGACMGAMRTSEAAGIKGRARMELILAGAQYAKVQRRHVNAAAACCTRCGEGKRERRRAARAREQLGAAQGALLDERGRVCGEQDVVVAKGLLGDGDEVAHVWLVGPDKAKLVLDLARRTLRERPCMQAGAQAGMRRATALPHGCLLGRRSPGWR